MLQNLTISADPAVIALARQRAASEHTTLNAVVRRFLVEFARTDRSADYDAAMAALGRVRSGGRFTRDEANAR